MRQPLAPRGWEGAVGGLGSQETSLRSPRPSIALAERGSGTVRIRIATLIVASLFTILASGAIAWATPTRVNVRIEGATRTLFEGPIWTVGHEVEASSDTTARSCNGIDTLDPQNTQPGPTSTAASVDAMSIIGETFNGKWYSGFGDYLITRWGPDREQNGESWGILVNNVFTNVGGCQYELGTGNEVLWVYNAFAARPFLALLPVADHYTSGPRPLTATAELGKPFEVEVLEYSDEEEDIPPAEPQRNGATPFTGADVSPVRTSEQGYQTVYIGGPGTVMTNAAGKASITFTTPGWHRIKATKLDQYGNEAVIRSNRLDVCVPALGQTDCGTQPVEDAVRTPPTVTQELEHAHDVTREEEPSSAPEGAEEFKEPGTTENTGAQQPGAGDGASGGQSNTGMQSSVSGSDTTTAAAATTLTDHSSGALVTALAIKAISPARLLLKFAAPGVATAKFARLRGRGHHRHFQTVKTITVKASKAGVLKVKLPRLVAGSYQVSISLAGAKTVIKTLTVPRT
jgi:hypothetical protein